MKDVALPILAASLFIVLVGLLNQGKLISKEVKEEKVTVVINAKEIQVEVADDNDERRRGLSGRESLEESKGMLFVFDEENVTPKFWMKDMNFSLDIIWIDDNLIVQIDENVAPEKDTPDEKLTLYQPKSPVDSVLEVVSGFAEKEGIKVGSEVKITGL